MHFVAHVKIGSFLRDCRLKAQLQLSDIARHLGQSEPYILRIESGEQSLSLGEIYAFANVYNVPPDELIDFLLEANPSEQDANFPNAQDGEQG